MITGQLRVTSSGSRRHHGGSLAQGYSFDGCFHFSSHAPTGQVLPVGVREKNCENGIASTTPPPASSLLMSKHCVNWQPALRATLCHAAHCLYL